jgi:SAM-dependent methyltransferase
MAHDAAHHHHYDHYSPAMAARLDGFYGRVDERLNARIARWIEGESVLDVGCGFGQLTDYLRRRGHAAVGVDLLEPCIEAGRARFPQADLRLAKSEDLDFPDKSFDTVVLKDTIHHIYAEDDVGAFLADVRRVARRRLVIQDPNPMAILLAARKLIGHVDPVCGPADAQRVVTEAGFRVTHLEYSELFAFPMSGGYVGPVMVPARPRWLGGALLAADEGLMALLRPLRLARFVAWRYLLVADLPK